MAGAVVAGRPARVSERSDHQLVSAVRRGDERAFEQLYSRYQRPIAAYVLGMVRDRGRAEDIAQEVFVSALRRMRQTERPIAFKPWIYEIARNACIDQFRRSRRAEEVSYDAEEGLGAADYGRLVTTGPTPDVAVDQKMSLDHLTALQTCFPCELRGREMDCHRTTTSRAVCHVPWKVASRSDGLNRICSTSA